MYKITRLLVATLAVMMIFANQPASAYDGCTGIVKVKARYRPEINSGFLAMRTGPGTGYPEMYHLLRNTEVLVFEHRGRWWQVHYNGKTGYAFGRYIKLYCP